MATLNLSAHTYEVYVEVATLVTVPVAIVWHGIRSIFEHWRWRAERTENRRWDAGAMQAAQPVGGPTPPAVWSPVSSSGVPDRYSEEVRAFGGHPSFPAPSDPHPGWKPDPWGTAGHSRYWNGASWTTQAR